MVFYGDASLIKGHYDLIALMSVWMYIAHIDMYAVNMYLYNNML